MSMCFFVDSIQCQEWQAGGATATNLLIGVLGEQSRVVICGPVRVASLFQFGSSVAPRSQGSLGCFSIGASETERR